MYGQSTLGGHLLAKMAEGRFRTMFGRMVNVVNKIRRTHEVGTTNRRLGQKTLLNSAAGGACTHNISEPLLWRGGKEEIERCFF